MWKRCCCSDRYPSSQLSESSVKSLALELRRWLQAQGGVSENYACWLENITRVEWLQGDAAIAEEEEEK